MSKNKKTNIIIWVLIIFIVVFALLPVFISLNKNDESKKDNVVITDVDLDIVDYSIEFQQNAYSINLLSGEIKTNVKIENVFINANGVGCQYLHYNQSLNETGYYVITITPISGILNTVFNSDARIIADIYVEYANRSYKIVSKDIDVKSCWTDFY